MINIRLLRLERAAKRLQQNDHPGAMDDCRAVRWINDMNALFDDFKAMGLFGEGATRDERRTRRRPQRRAN